MKLVLIRHGETVWNTETRVQGRTDIPLDETGRIQAQKLGIALKDVHIDAVYSGPLSRAYDTALQVAVHHGLDVVTDELITEINFGEWEGRSAAELQIEFPLLWGDWNWILDEKLSASIGAESGQHILERSLQFVKKLIASHDNSETIAIASHTMPLKMLIAYYTGMQLNRIRSIKLDNTGVSVLKINEGVYPQLMLLNGTSHLKDGRLI